jgi:hypothetical protein
MSRLRIAALETSPVQVRQMRIINNDDVSRLLTMADCIRVQEEAFRKIPED